METKFKEKQLVKVAAPTPGSKNPKDGIGRISEIKIDQDGKTVRYKIGQGDFELEEALVSATQNEETEVKQAKQKSECSLPDGQFAPCKQGPSKDLFNLMEFINMMMELEQEMKKAREKSGKTKEEHLDEVERIMKADYYKHEQIYFLHQLNIRKKEIMKLTHSSSNNVSRGIWMYREFKKPLPIKKH
jgi:hypothetical protein